MLTGADRLTVEDIIQQAIAQCEERIASSVGSHIRDVAKNKLSVSYGQVTSIAGPSEVNVVFDADVGGSAVPISALGTPVEGDRGLIMHVPPSGAYFVSMLGGNTSGLPAFDLIAPPGDLGSLLVNDGLSHWAVLDVGTDGQVVVANSLAPLGVEWTSSTTGGLIGSQPNPVDSWTSLDQIKQATIDVAAVGDSLVYIADGQPSQQLLVDDLTAAGFSPNTIVANVGDDTNDLAAATVPSSPDILVIALGTNDCHNGAIPLATSIANLTAFINRIDPTVVVWVNVDETTTGWQLDVYAPDYNAALLALGYQMTLTGRQFVLADWAAQTAVHPEYMNAGGPHHTPAGQVAYRALIVGAVQQAALHTEVQFAEWILRTQRGNALVPAALNQFDVLGAYSFGGYGATDWHVNPSALFSFATEDFTDLASGTAIGIAVTPQGTTTRVEGLRVTGNDWGATDVYVPRGGLNFDHLNQVNVGQGESIQNGKIGRTSAVQIWGEYVDQQNPPWRLTGFDATYVPNGLTVTSASANFTQADVGKYLRALGGIAHTLDDSEYAFGSVIQSIVWSNPLGSGGKWTITTTQAHLLQNSPVFGMPVIAVSAATPSAYNVGPVQVDAIPNATQLILINMGANPGAHTLNTGYVSSTRGGFGPNAYIKQVLSPTTVELATGAMLPGVFQPPEDWVLDGASLIIQDRAVGAPLNIVVNGTLTTTLPALQWDYQNSFGIHANQGPAGFIHVDGEITFDLPAGHHPHFPYLMTWSHIMTNAPGQDAEWGGLGTFGLALSPQIYSQPNTTIRLDGTRSSANAAMFVDNFSFSGDIDAHDLRYVTLQGQVILFGNTDGVGVHLDQHMMVTSGTTLDYNATLNDDVGLKVYNTLYHLGQRSSTLGTSNANGLSVSTDDDFFSDGTSTVTEQVLGDDVGREIRGTVIIDGVEHEVFAPNTRIVVVTDRKNAIVQAQKPAVRTSGQGGFAKASFTVYPQQVVRQYGVWIDQLTSASTPIGIENGSTYREVPYLHRLTGDGGIGDRVYPRASLVHVTTPETTIQSIVWSAPGTYTVTTTSPHGLAAGNNITIDQTAPEVWGRENVNVAATPAPTATQFTLINVGGNPGIFGALTSPGRVWKRTILLQNPNIDTHESPSVMEGMIVEVMNRGPGTVVFTNLEGIWLGDASDFAVALVKGEGARFRYSATLFFPGAFWFLEHMSGAGGVTDLSDVLRLDGVFNEVTGFGTFGATYYAGTPGPVSPGSVLAMQSARGAALLKVGLEAGDLLHTYQWQGYNSADVEMQTTAEIVGYAQQDFDTPAAYGGGLIFKTRANSVTSPANGSSNGTTTVTSALVSGVPFFLGAYVGLTIVGGNIPPGSTIASVGGGFTPTTAVLATPGGVPVPTGSNQTWTIVGELATALSIPANGATEFEKLATFRGGVNVFNGALGLTFIGTEFEGRPAILDLRGGRGTEGATLPTLGRRLRLDGATTVTTNIITSATISFTASDVGRAIAITGPSVGNPLVNATVERTISQVDSLTQARVSGGALAEIATGSGRRFEIIGDVIARVYGAGSSEDNNNPKWGSGRIDWVATQNWMINSRITTFNITDTSAAVTTASAFFVPEDVGRYIAIGFGGVPAGTAILSYNSPTSVVLTAPANATGAFAGDIEAGAGGEIQFHVTADGTLTNHGELAMTIASTGYVVAETGFSIARTFYHWDDVGDIYARNIFAEEVHAPNLFVLDEIPTNAINVATAAFGQVGFRTYDVGATFVIQRVNGGTTDLIPGTPVLSGQTVGQVGMGGAHETAAAPGVYIGALIGAIATQDYSTSLVHGGTQLLFQVTPNDTQTRTTALTLDHNLMALFPGHVAVGDGIEVTGGFAGLNFIGTSYNGLASILDTRGTRGDGIVGSPTQHAASLLGDSLGQWRVGGGGPVSLLDVAYISCNATEDYYTAPAVANPNARVIIAAWYTGGGGGTLNYRTQVAHGYSTGNTVTITGATPVGWNKASVKVTATSTTTFAVIGSSQTPAVTYGPPPLYRYEVGQGSEWGAWVIENGTKSGPIPITGATYLGAQDSGTARFACPGHPFIPGQHVKIEGANPSGWNSGVDGWRIVSVDVIPGGPNGLLLIPNTFIVVGVGDLSAVGAYVGSGTATRVLTQDLAMKVENDSSVTFHNGWTAMSPRRSTVQEIGGGGGSWFDGTHPYPSIMQGPSGVINVGGTVVMEGHLSQITFQNFQTLISVHNADQFMPGSPMFNQSFQHVADNGHCTAPPATSDRGIVTPPGVPMIGEVAAPRGPLSAGFCDDPYFTAIGGNGYLNWGLTSDDPRATNTGPLTSMGMWMLPIWAGNVDMFQRLDYTVLEAAFHPQLSGPKTTYSRVVTIDLTNNSHGAQITSGLSEDDIGCYISSPGNLPAGTYIEAGSVSFGGVVALSNRALNGNTVSATVSINGGHTYPNLYRPVTGVSITVGGTTATGTGSTFNPYDVGKKIWGDGIQHGTEILAYDVPSDSVTLSRPTTMTGAVSAVVKKMPRLERHVGLYVDAMRSALQNRAMAINAPIEGYFLDYTHWKAPFDDLLAFIGLKNEFILDYPAPSLGSILEFSGKVSVKQDANLFGLAAFAVHSATYKNSTRTIVCTQTANSPIITAPPTAEFGPGDVGARVTGNWANGTPIPGGVTIVSVQQSGYTGASTFAVDPANPTFGGEGGNAKATLSMNAPAGIVAPNNTSSLRIICNADLGPVYTLLATPIFEADDETITAPAMEAVRIVPTFRKTAGTAGTLSIGSYTSFRLGAVAGDGATIPERKAIAIDDVTTLGTGAVGFNYGIYIASLSASAGGVAIGIRNASSTVLGTSGQCVIDEDGNITTTGTINGGGGGGVSASDVLLLTGTYNDVNIGGFGYRSVAAPSTLGILRVNVGTTPLGVGEVIGQFAWQAYNIDTTTPTVAAMRAVTDQATNVTGHAGGRIEWLTTPIDSTTSAVRLVLDSGGKLWWDPVYAGGIVIGGASSIDQAGNVNFGGSFLVVGSSQFFDDMEINGNVSIVGDLNVTGTIGAPVTANNVLHVDDTVVDVTGTFGVFRYRSLGIPGTMQSLRANGSDIPGPLTGLTVGQVIGVHAFIGYNQSSTSYLGGVAMSGVAEENMTAVGTHGGARIEWSTTPNVAAAPLRRMALDNAGTLWLGLSGGLAVTTGLLSGVSGATGPGFAVKNDGSIWGGGGLIVTANQPTDANFKVAAGGLGTFKGGLAVQAPSLGATVMTLSSLVGGGLSLPTEQVVQGRIATNNAALTVAMTIPIPTSTTVLIEAHVVARRVSGTAAADEGAGQLVVATVRGGAGPATATLIDVPATLGQPLGGAGGAFAAVKQKSSGWATTPVTIDASGQNARVMVTGVAGTVIAWAITVHMYPVTN